MLSFQQQHNLERFERLASAIKTDLDGSTAGPFRQGMRRAGMKYLDAMQHRFIQFSRGGGDWPALSPTTLARRLRRGRNNRTLKTARRLTAMNSHMLYDTTTLFTALTPQFPANAPGQVFEDIPNGVRMGYGGSTIHPATGRVKIVDVANWQHRGTSRIPARPIMVVPAEETKNQIRAEMQSGLNEMVAQAAASP